MEDRSGETEKLGDRETGIETETEVLGGEGVLLMMEVEEEEVGIE